MKMVFFVAMMAALPALAEINYADPNLARSRAFVSDAVTACSAANVGFDKCLGERGVLGDFVDVNYARSSKIEREPESYDAFFYGFGEQRMPSSTEERSSFVPGR